VGVDLAMTGNCPPNTHWALMPHGAGKVTVLIGQCITNDSSTWLSIIMTIVLFFLTIAFIYLVCVMIRSRNR